MSWRQSLQSYIWIFPVGRGNAAFIRTALNQGFILDMAGGNFCDPARFIKDEFVSHLDTYVSGKQSSKIAQVVLSHPHADHIAQCGELESGVLHPVLLTCPHHKSGDEAFDWDRIEVDDIHEQYQKLYHGRNLPLQTIKFNSSRTVPNLEYGVYYIRPPVCSKKIHDSDDACYVNSTSIVFYYRHGSHSILFPGDMTPEGMKWLIDRAAGVEKRYTVFDRGHQEAHPQWYDRTSDQPSFVSLLKGGVTILVAPHHGLESCYSTDLYDAMKPGKPSLVMISERRKTHEGDGSTDVRYQCEDAASGLTVDIEGDCTRRRSFSTKDGHHVLIVFSGTGLPKVYARRDPKALLGFADI